MTKTLITFGLVYMMSVTCYADEKIKVLVIDGQNNHGAWSKTTPLIIKTLEKAGRFDVTHTQTPAAGKAKPNYSKCQPEVKDMPEDLQKEWAKWRPDFSKYDVIVSNYNGVLWPDEVRAAFEKYMKEGGGLVVVHAADNAFAQWQEYNKMIGVGGWYGRNEKCGPKIYWENGKLVKDNSPGKAGSHGKKAPVILENQAPDHPVMKGMPAKWMHPLDEIYCNMRGPAENITVLATAYSDKKQSGSGKQQPTLMALSYGKGRVIHEMLGHDERGFMGLGFQETLKRGTEWAATGKVTFPPVKEGSLSTEEAAVSD